MGTYLRVRQAKGIGPWAAHNTRDVFTAGELELDANTSEGEARVTVVD
jgi:hypothetical protein